MMKDKFVNKLTGETLPFQTRYSYVNDKVEKSGKPSDTDETLFVPLKTMINKIVRGDLSQLSNAYFDDEHEDPTDAPGYDIADAFEDAQKVQDIINEQSQQEEPKAEPVVQTETPVSGKIDSERNSNES